jgi:voltage-gated potassium channel
MGYRRNRALIDKNSAIVFFFQTDMARALAIRPIAHNVAAPVLTYPLTRKNGSLRKVQSWLGPGNTAIRVESIRRKLHRQLEPSAWVKRGLSPTNWLLASAIIAATLLAIVQTEPLIVNGREHLFDGANLLFGLLFLTEYIARLWACAEDDRYRGIKGRISYAFTLGALLDLGVVLVSLAPIIVGSLFPLRLLRLFAIVRFAKLGRFSTAMKHLAGAVVERRHELMLTVLIAMTLIVLGAAAMWAAEGDVQPDKFGSIPRAMWWAAITLTTIGYGDVYPITIVGKIIAVLVAVAGIGLIAMPAGILAAAFSDAMTRSRKPE